MQTRKIRTIALTALSLAALTIAAEPTDDPTPKTPAARAALAKLANAQDAAKKAYDKAIKEAMDIAVKDLEAAKSAAMKAGNLEEANRIQASIDALKSESQNSKTIEATVKASDDWQAVGEVIAGRRYLITATGKWSASNYPDWMGGPDGISHPKKGSPVGYLEGRIGKGEPFRIGSKHDLRAESSGVLQMRMNDAGGRDDNQGAVRIRIESAVN